MRLDAVMADDLSVVNAAQCRSAPGARRWTSATRGSCGSHARAPWHAVRAPASSASHRSAVRNASGSAIASAPQRALGRYPGCRTGSASRPRRRPHAGRRPAYTFEPIPTTRRGGASGHRSATPSPMAATGAAQRASREGGHTQCLPWAVHRVLLVGQRALMMNFLSSTNAAVRLRIRVYAGGEPISRRRCRDAGAFLDRGGRPLSAARGASSRSRSSAVASTASRNRCLGHSTAHCYAVDDTEAGRRSTTGWAPPAPAAAGNRRSLLGHPRVRRLVITLPRITSARHAPGRDHRRGGDRAGPARSRADRAHVARSRLGARFGATCRPRHLLSTPPALAGGRTAAVAPVGPTGSCTRETPSTSPASRSTCSSPRSCRRPRRPARQPGGRLPEAHVLDDRPQRRPLGGRARPAGPLPETLGRIEELAPRWSTRPSRRDRGARALRRRSRCTTSSASMSMSRRCGRRPQCLRGPHNTSGAAPSAFTSSVLAEVACHTNGSSGSADGQVEPNRWRAASLWRAESRSARRARRAARNGSTLPRHSTAHPSRRAAARPSGRSLRHRPRRRADSTPATRQGHGSTSRTRLRAQRAAAQASCLGQSVEQLDGVVEVRQYERPVRRGSRANRHEDRKPCGELIDGNGAGHRRVSTGTRACWALGGDAWELRPPSECRPDEIVAGPAVCASTASARPRTLRQGHRRAGRLRGVVPMPLKLQDQAPSTSLHARHRARARTSSSLSPPASASEVVQRVLGAQVAHERPTEPAGCVARDLLGQAPRGCARAAHPAEQAVVLAGSDDARSAQ